MTIEPVSRPISIMLPGTGEPTLHVELAGRNGGKISGGWRANFTGLVLGCIEADFASILTTSDSNPVLR